MRVINQRSAPPSLGPSLAESDAQFFMPIFVGKIWYAYAIQQGWNGHGSFLHSTVDIPSGYVKIAIEKLPFIVDLPIEHGDFPIFSIAMLNYQRVCIIYSGG